MDSGRAPQRRAAQAAQAASISGEAYITRSRRRLSDGTWSYYWLLRLPRDIDPRRSKFSAPFTPEGLASLVDKRDRMIRVIEADRRDRELHAAAAATPTFGEVMDDYLSTDPVKHVEERRRQLELHVLPLLGHLPIVSVNHHDVTRVLEVAVDKGLSKQTCGHVKKAVSAVVRFAFDRDEIPSVEFLSRARIPRRARPVDPRPRMLLSDQEFEQFVSSEAVPLWLRVLAVMARCMGGARTSDLHELDWQHVDTCGWKTMFVPRPKTSRTRASAMGLRHVIVPLAGQFLRRWWLACGRPESGPVFGAMRSRRHGQGQRGAKKGRGVGYAATLRKWLLVAGVNRHELHHDTEVSRRCDFHSFRRAFNTALARANVNAQQAMLLAGHTTMSTHLRYVMMAEAIAPPAEAMPNGGKPTVCEVGSDE